MQKRGRLARHMRLEVAAKSGKVPKSDPETQRLVSKGIVDRAEEL